MLISVRSVMELHTSLVSQHLSIYMCDQKLTYRKEIIVFCNKRWDRLAKFINFFALFFWKIKKESHSEIN